MKYIQGTIALPLILSINKPVNIKWYFDAAFVVHKYKRSHTGGFITMGTVWLYVNSSKQKLNTNISTDANIVGVDYVLTNVIWTWYFLKDQGYKIYDNIIYQDNQSAIKLDKNYRKSRRKGTRQINTRYYFITDWITKQEASVELCPTLDIIGDYFTKALQESQLIRFLNIIIGIH